ncbi:YciI family protein [Thiobacillus denitrificans]|uniref:YciI family protein n=1 Tax=Thiobacillus denitrificans TaxID=36861 RepID=UPI000364C586|nr:YciI family protein [Thiobacillus denitrificans]
MWWKSLSMRNEDTAMRYMLMIVEPRGQRDTRSEDEGRALYAEMVEFGQGLAARGQLVASESLRPDSHGVRVQRRGEASALVDGPFAEAREMVGGFYLIECANRDEAVRIAENCPAARFATVEVRECAPCYVN